VPLKWPEHHPDKSAIWMLWAYRRPRCRHLLPVWGSKWRGAELVPWLADNQTPTGCAVHPHKVEPSQLRRLGAGNPNVDGIGGSTLWIRGSSRLLGCSGAERPPKGSSPDRPRLCSRSFGITGLGVANPNGAPCPYSVHQDFLLAAASRTFIFCSCIGSPSLRALMPAASTGSTFR